MNDGLGLIIESLVAILLILTIGYCMMLNRRLKLLRADEDALRATIAELVTATEIAERAIAGLKLTVRECDAGLGERLERGERMSADLDRKLGACKGLIDQLRRIVLAGRADASRVDAARVEAERAEAARVESVRAETARIEPAKLPAQDPQAIAAAAQAFAERLRHKVFGLAA